MSIKLLTFDLDDTLWPCMVTIDRTEKRLHQWFNTYHPQVSTQYTIKQLRNKRLQLAEEHPHIAHDLTALRKKSLLQLSLEMGYSEPDTDLFIRNAFQFYISERNKVDLYDDVIPTLTALKPYFRLAAVSNGNADIIQIGLGNLFEFSWSAAEAGQQKPHPIVFESLLDQQQLTPDEVIHIGDDPVADIQGAQQSGIKAIWLNRDNNNWPAEIKVPFLEINQLKQLPQLLNKLCVG